MGERKKTREKSISEAHFFFLSTGELGWSKWAINHRAAAAAANDQPTDGIFSLLLLNRDAQIFFVPKKLIFFGTNVQLSLSYRTKTAPQWRSFPRRWSREWRCGSAPWWACLLRQQVSPLRHYLCPRLKKKRRRWHFWRRLMSCWWWWWWWWYFCWGCQMRSAEPLNKQAPAELPAHHRESCCSGRFPPEG